VSDDSALEALLQALCASDDRPVTLPGVGRLSVKRYRALPTASEKRLAFFSPDPALYRVIAGSDNAADDDAASGLDAIAATIRRHLRKRERAEIPELGVFEVIDKGGKSLVQFRAAESLKARLNPPQTP